MPKRGSAEGRLDPSQIGKDAAALLAKLNDRVIGQSEAVKELVRAYVNHKAGLSPTGRPIANYLLVGPTGCGKTLVCQTIAELLTGKRDALVRIDCAEYQDRHEIAKLIGSPPGYLGHRETSPVITQQRLDKQFTEECQISFVLFDEIDKAHPGLLNLLLGVLDYGQLKLGDGAAVSFERTVILMTANTGAREMQEALMPTWGLSAGRGSAGDGLLKAGHVGAEITRKSITPELMNRIDKILVFHQLSQEDISKVMELELDRLHKRLLEAKKPLLITFDPPARDFILKDGYDARYGARHLKRSLVRNLETPIANLIVSGQIGSGSHVRVSQVGEGLEFTEL